MTVSPNSDVQIDWRSAVRTGLIGAAVALFVCVVGIVPVFHQRALIKDIISLGQTVLVLTALGIGARGARAARATGARSLLPAMLAAGIAGGALTALILVGQVINLRGVFLNASPDLYDLLTFGLGASGAWIPLVSFAAIGTLGGPVASLPTAFRRPITTAVLTLLLAALFAGIFRSAMLTTPLAATARVLFAPVGLTVIGAIALVIAFAGGRELLAYTHVRQRVSALPRVQRRVVLWPIYGVLALAVLVMPQTLGPFVAQVVALVALYVLLGLGLNITLGLAGLLDLGFVAFFAVGAYTVGLLTSTAEYGIADWPFWAAVIPAVLLAMVFGAILGLPILGIRGDYLAIATLGFGEIIRVLAGSDLLKPFLGGPRGILNIPKPIDVPPDHILAGPNQIYYIALICAALIAFVAWRLRASRLGRAWLSIREDEDVAEALGVNLVQTKLLAYMLGAAFAGLGGAIFAGLIGSIFSSSIQLQVSINVVAIVVVGGMGSIPGAVLGAVFLIGVPELFREFSEYRFLFYGMALIAMMLYRPEGLIPTRFATRELHLDATQTGGEALLPPTEAG